MKISRGLCKATFVRAITSRRRSGSSNRCFGNVDRVIRRLHWLDRPIRIRVGFALD